MIPLIFLSRVVPQSLFLLLLSLSLLTVFMLLTAAASKTMWKQTLHENDEYT